MVKMSIVGLFVFASAFAHADPRTDVQDIAVVIERNYFDAERATTIANDLREQARAGDFERFVEREALAAELTQRLRKIDGHFSVKWSSRASARPSLAVLPASRTNYGFKRVERLAGNVGYIQLAYVADIDFKDASSPARRAADAALTLTRDADVVILDVRNNGGGAPSMVGYLVSAFVPAKANVYNTFHSRDGPVLSERPDISYATPMMGVPLYVLANRKTASAAESIAFTLQSAKRAIVVGERTAGAANPGEPFRTSSRYTVFVSTGAPRNPINGRNWEGEGVKPDVDATSDRALPQAHRLALEKILEGPVAGVARKDAQDALDALKRGN